MKTENTPDPFETDMFGAPLAQIRERWGRPSTGKSKENQLFVVTRRGAGWSQERIAGEMGCDTKTLRKHFSRELSAGVDFLEGMALEVLVAKMREGSVSAAKKVLDICAQGKAAPPAPASHDDVATMKPLGKKEELTEAANKPGSSWGGLLPH